MIAKTRTGYQTSTLEFSQRQTLQEERRQKLVKATVTAMYQFGFAGSTVARIAALAGISAGNVHHYFGGKDGLLEEAMRSQLSTVRTETSRRLSTARQPIDRLRAIIESNFVPEIYTREVCTAWLHFVAHATNAPQLSRLARINNRRLQSNLVATLRAWVDAPTAKTLASASITMIDGLWMHRAQGADDDQEAAQVVLGYLERVLHQRNT